ncbi:uncharacterized protein CLUP02_07907 [Colletotrichum lupini]|uniref:Uncharacterized protein n=1 Tax=Colletotrichum lupini TaxID=145971 RepID=A0A9Q8WGE5_9PEZI|nr:uncharacterized protein CLUP02_07907 [Colletotrichum lupini]UQC82419.1 hypothetical protein CLUP02_07907 [Colletotrichum lupini]
MFLPLLPSLVLSSSRLDLSRRGLILGNLHSSMERPAYPAGRICTHYTLHCPKLTMSLRSTSISIYVLGCLRQISRCQIADSTPAIHVAMDPSEHPDNLVRVAVLRSTTLSRPEKKRQLQA